MIRRAGAAVLAAVALTSCTETVGHPRAAPPPPSVGGSPTLAPIAIPVVVGAEDPDDFPLRESLLDGIHLAEERINDSGGIDGHPIEVVETGATVATGRPRPFSTST